MIMETSNIKKNSKFGHFFSVIFCLVSFALIVTMADIFSSLITVGGFSFSTDNINLSEYKVYAVCTSSHQEKVMAQESAESIKKQGGAGFIYMNKSSYNVVAGIYETEADAKKVLSNIIEKKPDSMIVTITIPSIIISNNLSSQEKTTVNECLVIFKNVYKKLYDISVSLDTAVLNEVNARLDVNSISSNVQNTLNNFNTIFSNNTNTSLLSLKLSLEEIQDYLKDLVEISSSIPFTAFVKETYCKVIMSYKNMAENF